ncbi:MAG: hypothetical protein K8R64_04730 [Methanosarcinaceae archaeon]|nr:hypothetical protein [Methanosarcinaceae archaeon]
MTLAIFLLSCPAYAMDEGGQYLHIDQMVLRFDHTDATVTLNYDLDIFAKVYVFAFGSRHLKPELEEIFFNYENVKMVEIGHDHAVIFLKDASRKSDMFYLHDQRELGATISSLYVYYPVGPSKNIRNTNVVPNLFYE